MRMLTKPGFIKQRGSSAPLFIAFLLVTLLVGGYFLYDSYGTNDELRSQLGTNQTELRNIQRELREKEFSISDKESQLSRLNRQRNSLRQQINQIKNTTESAQKELQTSLVQKEQEYAEIDKKYEDLQKELDKERSSNESFTSQIEALEQEKVALEQDKQALEQGHLELQKLNADYQQQLQDLTQSNSRFDEKFKAIEEQLAQQRALNTDYSATIETLEQRLAREQQALTDLENKLTELDSEKNRLVKQLEGGISIIRLDNSILFPSGSALLNERGQETLDLVAQTLEEFPNHLISVEGHADQYQITSVLTAKYPSNWELSAARAAYAIRYLTQKGIPAVQFQAVGYGSTRPINTASDVESQQENRRIEILLYPPREPASN